MLKAAAKRLAPRRRRRRGAGAAPGSCRSPARTLAVMDVRSRQPADAARRASSRRRPPRPPRRCRPSARTASPRRRRRTRRTRSSLASRRSSRPGGGPSRPTRGRATCYYLMTPSVSRSRPAVTRRAPASRAPGARPRCSSPATARKPTRRPCTGSSPSENGQNLVEAARSEPFPGRPAPQLATTQNGQAPGDGAGARALHDGAQPLRARRRRPQRAVAARPARRARCRARPASPARPPVATRDTVFVDARQRQARSRCASSTARR